MKPSCCIPTWASTGSKKANTPINDQRDIQQENPELSKTQIKMVTTVTTHQGIVSGKTTVTRQENNHERQENSHERQ
jgi:hypothetical protein